MARALVAIALLPVAGARAEGWNGSLAAASDYVYRGVSLSGGRPVLLVDLSGRTDSGWSAALGWAAPVYPSIGGKAEVTLAVARSWQLDPDWQLQASATRHRYYGSASADDYSHSDFGLSLDWQGRWLMSFTLSPDYSDFVEPNLLRTGRVLDLQVGVHQRLVDRLAFDAGLGYSDQRRVTGGGYLYGSLGLSWGAGPMLAYLTFIDSRAQANDLSSEGEAGPRWVASLMWSF